MFLFIKLCLNRKFTKTNVLFFFKPGRTKAMSRLLFYWVAAPKENTSECNALISPGFVLPINLVI